MTPETPSVLYTQGHVDAQAAEIDRLLADYVTAYNNSLLLAQECGRLRAAFARVDAQRGQYRSMLQGAEAAIDRVRGVIACHSHDSAACDLLDDLNVALED